MALDDIQRLKEKVDKDPASKFFVPLAEEYKKTGKFDEAIEVLTKGLEKQPDYMSARVALGKVYLDKGMLEEARAEFEKVIMAIPDNLYAHKKLAEIYRDFGQRDKAIKEFRTILKLNPMDEWATTNLQDIEKIPESPPAMQKPTKAEDVAPVAPEEVKSIEPEEIKEEQFELSVNEESAVAELVPELSEETEEDIQTKAVDIGQETEAITEEPLSFGDIFKKPEIEATGIEKEDISEAEPLSFADVFKEPGIAVEEKEEKEVKEVSEQPFLTVSDADSFVAQGKYVEAVTVYRRLLSIEPDNKQVMQRLDELKTLLKLLGKDKEDLIARLDSFLEAVRKRKNEFFGNT
ncbi:MAG: tetratricopeptide repeat protein [Nitrospirota bacterium]